MEWMPDFHLGWFNGWIPIVLLGLIDIVIFLLFPRDVVKRLFDRSGWSQRQVFFTILGKLIALLCLMMLFLTPLKICSFVFVIGMVFVILGIIGMVIALFNFKNTPANQPVTRGLYQFSRHPQIVMSSLVILGSCIAIGSWLALLMFLFARLLSHFSILAEEEVCLKQYGEDYHKYITKVPRYFLFF